MNMLQLPRRTSDTTSSAAALHVLSTQRPHRLIGKKKRGGGDDARARVRTGALPALGLSGPSTSDASVIGLNWRK